MLLIDHDQPQIAEGQKQGRARADHKLRPPLAHHLPQPAALGHRHTRMPFRRPRPEPRLHPGQKIRRQCDFGQKDQRLLPPPQTFGNRLKIHLGLARPGDTLQQSGRKPRTDLPHQRIGRRHLIAPQVAGRLGHQGRIGQIARRVLLGNHAKLDQALDDGRPASRLLGQFAQGHRRIAKAPQRLHHPKPRLGDLVRHRTREAVDLAHRHRIAQARRAGGQPQHRSKRRQRVIGSAG